MESEDGFALTLSLSPRRERPELCARLAPLNPPASGARDVPARSGSECNRRLGEGSGTSRLSEPLRPGTGRAPKEVSWKESSCLKPRGSTGQYHDHAKQNPDISGCVDG